MTTASSFDRLHERVSLGEPLTSDEILALAQTPHILQLGMLADTLRRRTHGGQVTYLRVATCRFDESLTEHVPPTAREVRLTGAPPSLDVAVSAVTQARAVAGTRTVSGFSWTALDSLATGGTTTTRVLEELRHAGLDAVAEVPIDLQGDLAVVLDRLAAAGFKQVRLTVDSVSAADRVALLVRAGELQDRFACVQAINPLPTILHAFRPTTGYEDVKMVAIARLAAPNIATVQVDWQRYGPKLAQVALTFGADDLDNVTASDDAPEGRRRAPLEEVRRNIEAAGFTPVERDGGFAIVNRHRES
jgi:aminodeoxyfutalosine synthase